MGGTYLWTDWRAFPPGRVCRVYVYDVELLRDRGPLPTDADRTLIAEKTYPEGAQYGWVVLAFAAPFLLFGAYRRIRPTRLG